MARLAESAPALGLEPPARRLLPHTELLQGVRTALCPPAVVCAGLPVLPAARPSLRGGARPGRGRRRRAHSYSQFPPDAPSLSSARDLLLVLILEQNVKEIELAFSKEPASRRRAGISWFKQITGVRGRMFQPRTLSRPAGPRSRFTELGGRKDSLRSPDLLCLCRDRGVSLIKQL